MRYLITLLIGISSLSGYSQYLTDSLRSPLFTVQVAADGAIENWRTVGAVSRPLMYAQNLWIGGLANGKLYQSSQMYRQSKINFFPGPISTNPIAGSRYNRVWRVTLDMVDSLRKGYYSVIPPIIYEWPAHGDTSFGEPWFLAPFVDVDGDSIYDPDSGDYPYIKGVESIFFVYNDAANEVMNDNALGLDIKGLLYRGSGGVLDSMFFVDYEITNRSDTTYTSSYLSSWADMDVGNPFDDLVGTDIHTDAVITYNGDSIDEGPGGFGYDLAAVTMFLRTGPYADYFNGIDDDRDGCIDGVRDSLGNCVPEDPVSGVNERMRFTASNYIYGGAPGLDEPNTEAEERNLMMGLCKSGNHKSVEGGYSVWDASIPSTFCTTLGAGLSFAFPGASFDSSGAVAPSSPVGWYESPDDKGDKKVLLTTGEFSIEPGETMHFDLGFLWQVTDSSTAWVNGGYNDITNKLWQATHLNVGGIDTSGLGSEKYHTLQIGSSVRVYFEQDEQHWVVRSQEGDHNLILTDVSGRILRHITLVEGESQTINLDRHPRGIYLLIHSQTGQVFKLSR